MTTPAEPTTPAVPAPPAEPASPPAALPAKPEPAPAAADETPEQQITALKDALKAANAEAQKARTTAKQNAADEARKELTAQFAKALGLVEDDTPDPAKLTEQVSTATAEAKQAKVELAVFHGAAAAGADATALLDSRAFMAKLADIDPADGTAVTAAITEAVKGNPAFSATRLPAPNPALGSSASGAPDLDAQIAAAQKAGDTKLYVHLQNQKLTAQQ